MSFPNPTSQADNFRRDDGTATATDTATATTPVAASEVVVIMVDVTAPSNLEGGYTFDAVHNYQVFRVTVPAGGVTAGQTFSVPFVPASNTVQAVAVAVPDAVPVPVEETTPLIASTLAPSAPPNEGRNDSTHRNAEQDPTDFSRRDCSTRLRDWCCWEPK